jgi:hypothetical protein
MIESYWTRNVGHIQVYRYHLEKPGHSLLIGACLCVTGLHPFWAVCFATAGYLFIGKVLVGSKPSRDWIADGIIGAFAIAAERLYAGDPLGLWLAFALIGLYAVVVAWWRWASP